MPGGKLQTHNQRIRSVPVVARTDMDLFKAEPAVKPLRPGIVGTHFEQHIICTAAASPHPTRVARSLEPVPAPSWALSTAMVCTSAMGSTHISPAYPMTVAVRSLSHVVGTGIALAQFVVEHLGRPGINGEHRLFQRVHGRNIVLGHRPGSRRAARSQCTLPRARAPSHRIRAGKAAGPEAAPNHGPDVRRRCGPALQPSAGHAAKSCTVRSTSG